MNTQLRKIFKEVKLLQRLIPCVTEPLVDGCFYLGYSHSFKQVRSSGLVAVVITIMAKRMIRLKLARLELDVFPGAMGTQISSDHNELNNKHRR